MVFNSKLFLPLLLVISTPLTHAYIDQPCKYMGESGVCVRNSDCTLNPGQVGSAKYYEVDPQNGYTCPSDPDGISCCIKKVSTLKDGVTKVIDGQCLNTSQCTGGRKTVNTAECPGSDRVKLCYSGIDTGNYGKPSERTCYVDGLKGVCVNKNSCSLSYGQVGNAKPYEKSSTGYSCPYDRDPDVWCCVKTVSTTTTGEKVTNGQCLNVSECSGTNRRTIDSAECPGSNNVKLCVDGKGNTGSGVIVNGVNRLTQCDYRWGDSFYQDCSGCTVCNWGCMITAITMAYNKIYNANETPISMCRNYGGKLDFSYDGDMTSASYQNLGFTRYDNESLQLVLNSLKKGYPVPFAYSKNWENTNQHWVLVYGYTGNGSNLQPSDFLVHDPSGKNRTNLQQLKDDYQCASEFLIYN